MFETQYDNQDKVKIIDIDSLKNGIPVITEGLFGIHKESCIVCFGSNGHHSGVKLELLFDDNKKGICEVLYDGEITQRLIKSYADKKKTTDYGACAIALLLIREYTCFVAEQAADATGSGIDYYLVNKEDIYDDDLLYNHSALLEVSGIRLETKDNSVDRRLEDKLRRLEGYNHDFSIPTYVIIVEFGKPYTRIYGLSV